MSDRVDFSGNAPIYDRRHGALVPDWVVSELLAVTGLPRGSRILDIGAGTGRTAIPFARQGNSVVAMDPAWAMLGLLRQKTEDAKVQPVAGNGTELPFAGHSFDAAVIARLLYLVPTNGATATRATTGSKSVSTLASSLKRPGSAILFTPVRGPRPRSTSFSRGTEYIQSLKFPARRMRR